MSRVAGTVDEIRVQENQAVQAGEILLSLADTDVLRNQQDEALANVAQAQAAIAHLKLGKCPARPNSNRFSAGRRFSGAVAAYRAAKERLIELRSKQSASEDELDAALPKKARPWPV